MEQVHIYKHGILAPEEADLPREFPLKLVVNEREIATLVASPHDLRFLVAGFLRLQGFVERLDDFQMLSVCEDFGIANVRVKKELPERLQPVLTSGCGTGVTFTIPAAPDQGGNDNPGKACQFTPAAIFAVMDELARRAENYRRHGGIHSAAVTDGRELLLYAEDIGRHNTIDRLAGEALLRGINVTGMALVTSGRVSSEMAAKAALLGVPLIASRTSPTDMAVTICSQAGITLVGYVRGGRFTVYSHAELITME
jgi:FdhD protein